MPKVTFELEKTLSSGFRERVCGLFGDRDLRLEQDFDRLAVANTKSAWDAATGL